MPIVGSSSNSSQEYQWSMGSEPMSPLTHVPRPILSPAFKQSLPPYIHSNTPISAISDVPKESFYSVNTADALAGKVIAIYFSASWCGPCRQVSVV